MNKKLLISCLMLLILISSAMILTSSSGSKPLPEGDYKLQDSFDKKAGKVPGIPAKTARLTYSFANEMLPGGPAVMFRMKKALKNYSFHNMQSFHLHSNAATWFPVIEPILRAYGVPEDFKYIPLVESGFKAGSSSKGASGFWQFMPETARGFGLKVNSEVDERHNVRKSTIAACKYIRALYREFGSWTLAAAAYNIGGTRLKRQMASQNQEDYYKMKLNRETSAYLFQLMSMKEIIEKPKLYGYFRKYNKPRVQPSSVRQHHPFHPLLARNSHTLFPVLVN